MKLLNENEGGSEETSAVTDKETVENAADTMQDPAFADNASAQEEAALKEETQTEEKKETEDTDKKDNTEIAEDGEAKEMFPPVDDPASTAGKDIEKPFDEKVVHLQAPAEETPTEEKEGKDGAVKRFLKKRWPILAGVGGVILAAYAAGALYFGYHTFPNTTINHVECSNLNKDSIEALLKEQVAEYTLYIEGKDGMTEIITPDKLNLSYEPGDDIKEAISSQNLLLWPASFFGKHDITLETDVEYDQDQVKTVLDALDCSDDSKQTESENAEIVFKDDSYEIQPEVMGTILDHDKFTSAVYAAIESLDSVVNLEEDDLYAYPEFTSTTKELVEAAEKMNVWIKGTVTYTFPSDSIEESIDAKRLSSWISFDKNKKEAKLNKTMIASYVISLASNYDISQDEHKFVNAIGDKVTISGGESVWTIDQKKEKKQIIKDIKAGKAVTRDPIWSESEGEFENSGIGTTYAEVDLTNQHMYFIKDGEVVMDSPVVTGNPNKGNGTPAGIFKVTYKREKAVLKGANYRTPVDFWMPFNHNVGFHDAKWQAYYGGTWYLRHGSHGCVNMPVSKAEELYSLIEKDMTVVVYENPTDHHTEEVSRSSIQEEAEKEAAEKTIQGEAVTEE